MLNVLIKKELKILKANWPKILFSLSLYTILLLSYQIFFPSYKSQSYDSQKTVLYIITLISFVIQSYLIKFESDPDYRYNVIGYIYKLHGNLFAFCFSKFLSLVLIALMHSILLVIILMLIEGSGLALLHSAAIFLYMIISGLMLMFANSLVLKNDTAFTH